MKKIFSLLLSLIMLVAMCVSVFANYIGPFDGIDMTSGVNPVVKLINGNKFQYIIYARNMQGMTNGDFTLTCAENLELVAVEETGNYDMSFYSYKEGTVKISYLYNDENTEYTVKMFVLTFAYEGEAIYPNLIVTNLAGTFIKSVAEVQVFDERTDILSGDVDENGRVNAADARAVLRHSANLEELPAESLAAANVNGDSVVNAADARIILRIAASLE